MHHIMKVHLIKQPALMSFMTLYPGSRAALTGWLQMVRFADWQTPGDILCTFRTADLLGNGSNRVVIDIGGNHYRIIAKYAFGHKQVHLFICWIGTHAEYNVLCKKRQQYRVTEY